MESARLFKVTVSFGSVTSQISLPCFMSHASIPAEVTRLLVDGFMPQLARHHHNIYAIISML